MPTAEIRRGRRRWRSHTFVSRVSNDAERRRIDLSLDRIEYRDDELGPRQRLEE
jgi:hypothetical protein